MGLLDKFRQHHKNKIDARNNMCDDLIQNFLEGSIQIDQLLDKANYIYTYEYFPVRDKWKSIHTQYLQQKRFLSKASSYKELEKRAAELSGMLSKMDQLVTKHNHDFLQTKSNEVNLLIGNIEGRPLDAQQMACIVKDAPNHLVIAGAGTGKTTTIVGKVKYLLKSGVCKEDEILVLSFTNAAAGEMKNRLLRETNANVMVSTFHKLGLGIINKAEGKIPNIYTASSGKFIGEQIEKQLADARFTRLFLQYLLFHKVNEKSEFEFDSRQSYEEYLEINPPMTIKGEVVKSYGELDIANFLLEHGVRYEYEAPYREDTRTGEYAQYHPDFFLPDYNIYIEYYGINRSGDVPSYYQGKDGKSASKIYQEGMQWKDKLHKENGTILIPCYFYEKSEGVLLERLKNQLENYSVPLQQISVDDLFIESDTNRDHLISEMSELFQTILALMKSNQYTPNDLKKMCLSPKYMGQKLLVDLFIPIYEKYENMLRETECIDFADMINQATKHMSVGQMQQPYKYVIIDEYQDISKAQYRLLQAMRNVSDFSLFCVGDDWQSIYRFAGSDIGYILNFSKYWGNSEISRIETTYRFSQQLIDISSEFIMKNPMQIRKHIRSGNNSTRNAIGEIRGYSDKWSIQFMKKKLEELPPKSTVFFIGRYQFDVDLLRNDAQFQANYDNITRSIRVTFRRRPDLQMNFYTAHRSKGLQADYVFIINNRNNRTGFPSKIQNPPLIELLLEQEDRFPDAEERRLFYVAMTRAKKKLYLVTVEKKISSFAKEIEAAHQSEMREEAFSCPICGAKLVRRNGQYGDFYGCSNFKNTGCKFTRKIQSCQKQREPR